MKVLNFGHIIIDKNGKKCNCGNNGCFETYASMKVLRDEIKAKRGLKEITGKELYKIVNDNLEEFAEIINEFIKNLNIGLSNYINIFEPEAICLGGSFVFYKEILLDRLINEMHKDNMTFNKNIPKIVVAKSGNDAGIIGATLSTK